MIFYSNNRTEWRQWLTDHYKTEKEVWFVFPMKGAADASLSYNDAVEEALCFGWIDSTVKPIDSTHRAQRFTPRRKRSPYSRTNIERLIWLENQGMIMPELLPSILPIIHAPFLFPRDIMEMIRKDPQAWNNFNSFSDPYKRVRIAYIEAARKRPEEFQKRLGNFLKMTHAGKMIKAYGGFDKY